MLDTCFYYFYLTKENLVIFEPKKTAIDQHTLIRLIEVADQTIAGNIQCYFGEFLNSYRKDSQNKLLKHAVESRKFKLMSGKLLQADLIDLFLYI